MVNTRYSWARMLIGCLLLALITSCTAAVQATLTPEPSATATLEPTVTATLEPTMTATLEPTSPPKPSPCDKVEGICLELTFDGQSCLYEGPENMKTEPVTLIFLNESDGYAATNLIRLLEDHTYQDVIDYSGEEPFTKHHPSWSVEYSGVWSTVKPGDSQIWKGVLEPGIHALVCARLMSFAGWLGGGFTVEE